MIDEIIVNRDLPYAVTVPSYLGDSGPKEEWIVRPSNGRYLKGNRVAWCKTNFGQVEKIWDVDGIEFSTGLTKFRFKNEKDAVLFALRWS